MREKMAKLTARHLPMEPLPAGGMPEITAEEIALSAALIKDDIEYNALMAACTKSPLAMRRVTEWIEEVARLTWATDYGQRPAARKNPPEPEFIDWIARMAILEWLSPNSSGSFRVNEVDDYRRTIRARNTPWTVRRRCELMQIGWRQWRFKYMGFYSRLLSTLNNSEMDASRIAFENLFGRG